MPFLREQANAFIMVGVYDAICHLLGTPRSFTVGLMLIGMGMTLSVAVNRSA